MSPPPDESELEPLVRKFSRLVRAVAARVGGREGRQIADDVEQQVFLNVWKQLQREQIIDNPSSYIYRCAVRETIRLLEVERRKDSRDNSAVEDDGVPAVAGDQAASRERRELLADALKSLPTDRRRAVQGYLAGFSVKELMGMYGWTYERARNLSARGMADLRTELRRQGING